VALVQSQNCYGFRRQGNELLDSGVEGRALFSLLMKTDTIITSPSSRRKGKAIVFTVFAPGRFWDMAISEEANFQIRITILNNSIP